MKELLDYFDGFMPLSADSRRTITDHISRQRIRKGENLWKSGERCNSLYFIQEGIFRLFFYTEKGDEITVHFTGARKFITDIESINTHTPSAVTCVAATDSDVVIIDHAAQKLFETAVPEWHQLVRKITEKALYDKIRTKDSLAHKESKEKYRLFIELFPEIVNHVKAGHIASYLGMSQYTLSHIKSEMAGARFFAK